jgi:hypothetical protein
VKSRFAAKAAVSATAAIPKTTGNSAQREAATKIAPTAVAKARVGRTKVRKTLTLDPELVLAFGDVEGGLSAAVNAALREHLARVKRQDALAARIAELEAEYGPADAVDVERFARHMR